MDRGRLQLGLMMLGVIWAQTARAESLSDHLVAARSAVAEGEKRAARRSLKLAEVAIVEGEGVVPPVHLARYWYLVGMELHLRRKSSKSMDAWRKVLIVDPRFEWDIELVADKDPRRLFEALRGEIRVRTEVDAQVPEKVGAATLWVDGARVRHTDVVSSGMHLLQVVCPDETVHGEWTELPSEKLDWLELCPDGVDTSVVIVEEAAGEDDFDGMAPDFDDMPSPEMSEAAAVTEEAQVRAAEVQDAATAREAEREAKREAAAQAKATRAADRVARRAAAAQASADRAAAREAKREEERAAKQAAGAQSAPADRPLVGVAPDPQPPEIAPDPKPPEVAPEVAPDPKPPEVADEPSPAPRPGPLSRLGPRAYALTAGGGLIVGGLVVNFAALEPTYAQVEDARAHPDHYTRWQADWLTSRFDTYRVVTLGLVGGGVVVAGAGYFLLDGPVQPMVLPGGAGLTGRW
jgi:hypothetical protein